MQRERSNTPFRRKDGLLKKIIKDPLIHFIIIGGALFYATSIFGAPPHSNNLANNQASNQIVVTTLKQKHLADLFEVSWQRTPNEDELNVLIQEHIKEEVYYREALALGLDEDDTVVRRRMRQKLEFMHEDAATTHPPSDDILKAYFEANASDYKTNSIFSFQHVLVSKSKDNTQSVASDALTKLRNGIPSLKLSKSSVLPITMELETARSIANTFGDDFLSQLAKLKIKQWQGPLTSPFGTHIVYVSFAQKAEPLSFSRARHKLEVNYMQEKREELAKQNYDNLQKRYRITIVKKP